MLEAAAKSAGIRDLLDEVISVEEVKIFKTSNRVYWLLAASGKQSGARFCLGEQLGRGRHGLGGAANFLDTAKHRRSSGRVGLPG